MARLLRTSLSRNAFFRWEPAPDLPPMEGDAGQINQVIMNLILNASEAVDPKGGTILLRTGIEALPQPEIDQSYQGPALSPGLFLTLEVAYDGPGMPPEFLDRIFEPFFTTKFTGRGLGLAAVQGILRSHHGGIKVTSVEGQGATFKLLFPVAPVRVQGGIAPAPEAQAVDFHGQGAVLVVDDEDSLRAMAAGALRRMGFETRKAMDGLEALHVFEANRERIVLILMDLTMPRMDGEEAYRRLRRAGAMTPIILSSGFGEDEALRRFRGKCLAGFLQKPYRFGTLVNTVRAALGGQAGRGLAGARTGSW